MAKLVRVDDMTYADLISLTGEIMRSIRKNMTIGYTIRLLLVFRNFAVNEKPKAPSDLVWQGFLKLLEKKDFDVQDIMTRFDKDSEIIIEKEGPVA